MNLSLLVSLGVGVVGVALGGVSGVPEIDFQDSLDVFASSFSVLESVDFLYISVIELFIVLRFCKSKRCCHTDITIQT